MVYSKDNGSARKQLDAIAQALGVSVESFNGDACEHAQSVELIRLWFALPGKVEQEAVLAHLRALQHGTSQ